MATKSLRRHWLREKAERRMYEESLSMAPDICRRYERLDGHLVKTETIMLQHATVVRWKRVGRS